jgi:flagellar biosynthesis/type III secretory pathway protein FliH
MPLPDTTTPPCRPGTRRIPAPLWDAAVEARRTLESAAREARALVDGAREQATAIRESAAAEGREEGLASVAELAARAALLRDRVLAQAEPELVELAFAVARRVLDAVAERDREVVVEVAGRALEAVRHRRQLTVRVHPDDATALREGQPRLCGRLTAAPSIAIVEDASVGRGGVVVETEAGTVDARLATQLEALRRAMAEDGGAPVVASPSTAALAPESDPRGAPKP